MAAINEKLRDIEITGDILGLSKDTVQVTTVTEEVAADSTDEGIDALLKAAQDSSSLSNDEAAFRKQNPLFALLNPAVAQNGALRPGSTVGYARLKDTSAINAMLALPQVKSLIPRNARLYWEMKPEGDF